jgi:hypothetical protein
MSDEQGTRINDQWSMNDEQWMLKKDPCVINIETMNNEQGSLIIEQWIVNKDKWTMNNERWTMNKKL